MSRCSSTKLPHSAQTSFHSTSRHLTRRSRVPVLPRFWGFCPRTSLANGVTSSTSWRNLTKEYRLTFLTASHAAPNAARRPRSSQMSRCRRGRYFFINARLLCLTCSLPAPPAADGLSEPCPPTGWSSPSENSPRSQRSLPSENSQRSQRSLPSENSQRSQLGRTGVGDIRRVRPGER